MYRRIKILNAKVKSDGFVATLRWLLITLYRKIIPQRQVIWCIDLTEINAEDYFTSHNYALRKIYSFDELDKEHYKILIERFSDVVGTSQSLFISKQFDRGAVLWLIMSDGQLAGYRWTIANDHTRLTHFPHTKKDVHGLALEIFPEFIGKGIFQWSENSFNLRLKNEGFLRLFSETTLWNKQAIKAFLKVNRNAIGIATKFTIFGKNVVIWHDMTGNIKLL